MGRPHEKGARICDDGLCPPTAYAMGHVYIVDDINPDATPTRRVCGKQKLPEHHFKCNCIRELFRQYSDYEVHSVRFPQGTRTPQFFAYWENELQSKTKDDLLIIYFHGRASNEEDEYSWTLSQYPKVQINAYDLIEMINNSKADSMFLLDCFIHTRVTCKWERESGNTEIIARPEQMKDSTGKPVEHDGDFTEALAANLENYIQEIKGTFKKHKDMKTIPNILSFDKTMYSNPLRIWLSRTRYGEKNTVMRFKLDPKLIRVNEKLEFFAVQMQGATHGGVEASGHSNAEENNNGSEEADADGRQGSVFNDEGLEDMDGEEEANETTIFVGN